MIDETAPDPSAYRGAPARVQESMDRWPWELCLKDPWVVPEPADTRPRFFETVEGAIMACTRLLRDPFDYVIRPRKSWHGTVISPDAIDRPRRNVTGPR